MSIWSRLVAGFLDGPLGALLGARPDARDRPGDLDEAATRSVAFTIGVVALGAKLAKADGTVTRDEVAVFRRVFQVPAAETANLARVFNRARQSTAGFESYARQIAKLFPDASPVLEDLLICLFQIARADGAVTGDERRFLAETARIFGFSDADFSRLWAEWRTGDDAFPDDPYAVLGVAADASDDAVKAAHRRLTRIHHPDRAIAEGLPEDFVAIATAHMARINAAFETIAKARGLR